MNKDIEIIMKTIDTQGNLIKAQQKTIETLERTNTALRSEVSLENDYDRKEYMLMLYLKSNPMIKDLIEELPVNISPDRITLKNLKVSIIPKPVYDEIYKDAMGITRDGIIPRSNSLKRKDRETKHGFTRERNEFYVE